jgi:putative oxidoreductase
MSAAQSFGLLILRLGMGSLMASIGYGKLQMLLNGGFDDFGDPIGLGKHASLILAVGAEFVCAILVMLGFATRFAAAAVAFTMGVAAFVVHKADPWTAAEGFKLFLSGATKFPVSKEPALLFLIAFLALVFTGAGRFSVDARIWPRWRARRTATTGGVAT